MAWSIFNLLNQKRSGVQDLPSKVFITNDGNYREYSDVADIDPSMRGKLDDLLNGVYYANNYINLFYSLPEVFAPIHQIASRVAGAVWQLKKTGYGDGIDTKNEYFNKLFTKSNVLYGTFDLIYKMVCYEILTGKAFVFCNKPAVLPPGLEYTVSMWALPAHRTTINRNLNIDLYTATKVEEFISSYTIPKPNGGSRVFETSQVIPVLHIDLDTGMTDINRCMPLLKGAEKAIRNLIPVYEARGVIYVRRGALGFIVNKAKDTAGSVKMTETQKKELIDQHNAQNGLQYGKNPIAISTSEIDFIKTSSSIQELQPFEETLADAIAIYSVLRVPKHLMPSKDNSTFANADADLKSFYADVIVPWANRYAQLFNNYFEVANRSIEASFEHIPVLQENRKEKSDVDKVYGEVWEKRWHNGACTLNDWIVAIGGQPVLGNNIFTKSIFELTDEENQTVKNNIINLKTLGTSLPPKNEAGTAAGQNPAIAGNGSTNNLPKQ